MSATKERGSKRGYWLRLMKDEGKDRSKARRKPGGKRKKHG